MRKRLIALLLTLAMAFTTMSPVGSLAENAGSDIGLTLEVSSASVTRGDTVTVTVNATKTEEAEIHGIQFEVLYDSNVFDKPKASAGSIISAETSKQVNNAGTGSFNVGMTFGTDDNGDIVPVIKEGGILYTLKLTVKADAVFGSTELKFGDVSYSKDNVSYVPTVLSGSTLTIVNPCTGITLDKDTLTIARGETATLTATVEPADTTNTIVWSSENDNIATVENGVVTAVGLGETTITAACGDKTASCKVTVTKATIAGTANIYTKEGFFYGATLGASPLITNAGWETAITTIKWYRDGEADSIATGDKYKIGEKDIGKQLYIIVTADKYTGELKSKLTDVIEKATKDAPAKPIIEANENVITVTNVDPNAEYMLMGDVTDFKFGKATTFKVNYGMTYYVIARYPETATHKESEEAQSDPVTIDKAPCNLTVTAGEGGTVDGIPEGTVREGDKVTLTAKPGDFDHKFVEWEVTGITLTEAEAKANPITFTMGNTDVTVKAVFAEKEAVIINFNVLNFTYDGTQKTPEIGPEEVVGMDRTIEYFDSLNNKLKSAPTEAGTYKVKVTFTSSEASEYRTTWADATFTIARAEQTAPAAPVLTNATTNSFEVTFVDGQEYAINTTGKEPADTEWAATITTTGLNPATDYYVFTRKAGSKNYNPSPAVYATVTTAHTYEWEVDGSGVVGVNVRVGGTLPESLTGTIKNEGTGTITNIKAALSGENVDNFKLDAVSTELASNGTLNIIVEPQGITTDNKGSYNVDVKVTADEVEYKIISFVISVVEKDPVIITGIDDKTVTFNGKTQGIDLSNANISGDAVDVSRLTVTYTKDGKTVAEPRDAGTYDVAISYEDTNYIGSTTAKLIINKKEVSVKGFEAQSKVYDGKADAEINSTNAKLYGMIEGTVVGFDKSGLTFKFDDKNVGTSKAVKNTAPITLTGTDAGNYNLTNPIVKLTADITRKPVTVTAAVAEKTYDGLTNNAAVTLSAPELIAGDDVQFDKVTGTYVTADAGDAVEVEVNYAISGADRGNYNITKAEEKTYGKVNKADLNVTLTAPAAVTYDGKTHEVSSVTDNRVAADNGKTLYTLTYNNKDALPVDAGTYSATAKLTDEGSKNYNLTANTVDVVINKAGMSATNKEYTVAFMLAGAQTRKLSELQLTPDGVSGKWSVATGKNEILDGEAKIDGANLVFNIKSGLTTADIGKKVELTLTFTPDKNYNPVTATVTVTLAQDTYTNSIVGTLPTQVKLGEALDLSGVKLVTKFGSGAPDQTLDVTDAAKVEMTTTYDAAATGEAALGAKTVTFTDKANSGITYTHTFTVVDVLEGVKLEADPTAYNYKLKEASSIGFDDKVHAVYKSGAKKALNHADVVLTMSDGTVVDSAKEARLLNTLGTAAITITYTEKYFDGTSDKQSVAITVSVTAAPVKPDGKPNAEGFAVTPIPDAGKEMEYKDDAGNEVKPEDVQGKLADAAPGTLEEEVKKNSAFNNVGDGDVVYENISFKDENGKPVTFANGKMQVTVPYPADSDKGDEFVMLIPDGEGKMKAIVPQKTAGGLQFEIENSNVTFAIGWYTPAPSPVLPTEPERDPEDNFWNEVYWTLLRSGQGSVITANAGYYDRVPQGVLRAVDISGNTLIINSAFGMQVVVNPGALEKLGMYRFYYPISYLKEMLKGSSVISGSGTTGITVGVLMPTTGDATVVEHPYTMTPATAGIIPGLESAANARPVIDNADGVSVLDGAQRNEGAVIGGGMLIGLGLLALLGAAYVTMRKRGN